MTFGGLEPKKSESDLVKVYVLTGMSRLLVVAYCIFCCLIECDSSCHPRPKKGKNSQHDNNSIMYYYYSLLHNPLLCVICILIANSSVRVVESFGTFSSSKGLLSAVGVARPQRHPSSLIDRPCPQSIWRQRYQLESVTRAAAIVRISDENNVSFQNGELGDKLPNTITRRSMLASAPLFYVALNGHVLPSHAEGSEESSSLGSKRKLLGGTVSLRPGVENETGSGSALYVTARPDRPDNVPRAILDGTGGKAPPVLAARFPNPTFPFDFSLNAFDLTAEGAAGANGNDLDSVKFWWEGESLVVSARLDSDGVATTRDPTDLVGRGIYKKGSNGCAVELQGRGIGGKFVTGAKK